jgi:hypothetical protein
MRGLRAAPGAQRPHAAFRQRPIARLRWPPPSRPAAAGVDLERAYTSHTYAPPPYLDGCTASIVPGAARRLPGRLPGPPGCARAGRADPPRPPPPDHRAAGSGLGIVATRDLRPGQLLMVVDPLCVIYGARGLAPENAQLAALLLARAPGLGERQRRWLALLLSRLPADGEAAAGEATQQQLQQALALLHAGDASEQPGGPPPEQQQPQEQQLALLPPALGEAAAGALVSSFAYCERYEDLAVCELRDQEPESFAGLWPAFALMNHS